MNAARATTAILCAAGVGVLGGCGGTGHRARAVNRTLTIYSSLPHEGPQRDEALDVSDAEQLALRQVNSEIGPFKVRLIALDDASARTGGWSHENVTANAQRAASDPTAIAYIGELTPGSSVASLQVLNRAGLLQVSPGDTAQAATATPSLHANGQTFARFVPSDRSEAGAQLKLMRTLSVRRLLVADDGSPYGRGIARAVLQQAASVGITPLTLGNRIPATDRALARRIAASRADALFFGASMSRAAVAVWDRVAAINPQMKLFGSSGLDNDAFAAAIDLGAQKQTFLSEPSVSPGGLPPAAQEFLAGFRAQYGRTPQAAAFFGYAALQAVLDSVHLAGRDGASRALVAKQFFALNDTASVLGNYSIAGDGNATLPPYFRFSTDSNGHRVFDTLVLAPPAVARHSPEKRRVSAARQGHHDLSP